MGTTWGRWWHFVQSDLVAIAANGGHCASFWTILGTHENSVSESSSRLHVHRGDGVLVTSNSVKICGHGVELRLSSFVGYSSLRASFLTVLGATRSSMSEISSRVRVDHSGRPDSDLFFRQCPWCGDNRQLCSSQLCSAHLKFLSLSSCSLPSVMSVALTLA